MYHLSQKRQNKQKIIDYPLVFLHTEILSIIIVNKMTGIMAVEASGGNDEIGYIEGQETIAIETARIALGQHKGLADIALSIDMTEIGASEETVVAA